MSLEQMKLRLPSHSFWGASSAEGEAAAGASLLSAGGSQSTRGCRSAVILLSWVDFVLLWFLRLQIHSCLLLNTFETFIKKQKVVFLSHDHDNSDMSKAVSCARCLLAGTASEVPVLTFQGLSWGSWCLVDRRPWAQEGIPAPPVYCVSSQRWSFPGALQQVNMLRLS